MNDEPLELHQALEAGLIPRPDAYSEQGQPLWEIQTLAAFWEQTPDQVEAELATLDDAVWKGPVYRIY